MTHDIVLDEKRQIGHNLLRLSGNLFYPIERNNPVLDVHVSGLHISNWIPVRLVERDRSQTLIPP